MRSHVRIPQVSATCSLGRNPTLQPQHDPELDVRHGYIKPAATKATQGHRLGAQRAAASKAAAAAAGGGWKMAKFLGTPPRVTAYMGGRGAVAPAAAIAEEGSGDDL